MPLPLGLAMVVRDERTRIEACLAPILPLLSEVVVVDTGSADGTPELLQQRFGIRVLRFPRGDLRRPPPLAEARNLGLAQLTTPWTLMLDADEQVEPAALARLAPLLARDDADGYFCRWVTYGLGPTFEDYKLCLFRTGFRVRGVVHENLQPDFRARGRTASWQDALVLQHRPNPAAARSKHVRRKQWLEGAIRREPDWYRHHWFLGYSLLRERRPEEAWRYLRTAADARSPRFPVESLNSRMALAALAAQRDDVVGGRRELEGALAFLEMAGDDFEVRVNFRARPWIEKGLALPAAEFHRLRLYRFAY